MKINALIIACSLIVTGLFSCNIKKYTISAIIKGLENDTVFVEYYPVSSEFDGSRNERIKYDTIVAHNNRFYCDLQVSENIIVSIYPKKIQILRPKPTNHYSPLSAYLSYLDSRYMLLFVEPGKPLNITGNIEHIGTLHYLSYQVKQPSFSSDYASDREHYKISQMIVDSINVKIEYNSSEAALFEERKIHTKATSEHKLSYIKNHLDKDLSAIYLLRQPLDTFGVYYPQLTESVTKGMFEKFLKSNYQEFSKHRLHQQAKEYIVEGATAPDFTLPNLAGEFISLSSLKGKYIVLDFWGSWCPPCIRGFSEMKKYYEKYKNKVEFVSIDCKDKDADWRNAVKQSGLDWIQLKDDESDDVTKKISFRYAVGVYPTKIILDKDLKIVAKFLGESEDFYKKLEDLFQ